MATRGRACTIISSIVITVLASAESDRSEGGDGRCLPTWFPAGETTVATAACTTSHLRQIPCEL